MSKEPDRIIHEVDGIAEQDNELPNWWLLTLFGAILFSLVYWMTYHMYGILPTPNADYQAEVDRLAALEAERVRAAGTLDNAALLTFSKDKGTVDKGREAYAANCTPCHLASGGGSIGPNLTDNAWLHGGSPEAIMKTIAGGVSGKGMPAWKDVLGSERVTAITAYVITLRGTNVAGGKAPQGEVEPER